MVLEHQLPWPGASAAYHLILANSACKQLQVELSCRYGFNASWVCTEVITYDRSMWSEWTKNVCGTYGLWKMKDQSVMKLINLKPHHLLGKSTIQKAAMGMGKSSINSHHRKQCRSTPCHIFCSDAFSAIAWRRSERGNACIPWAMGYSNLHRLLHSRKYKMDCTPGHVSRRIVHPLSSSRAFWGSSREFLKTSTCCIQPTTCAVRWEIPKGQTKETPRTCHLPKSTPPVSQAKEKTKTFDGERGRPKLWWNYERFALERN